MVGNPKQAGRRDGVARRSSRAGPQKPGCTQVAKRAATEKQVRRPTRAQRVIDFIEKLIVPSGVGQGGRLILREWQKKFIRDIYEPHGPDETGGQSRTVSIARKNGKTALIAALVLVHLVGPEAIENGEIYSAANDRPQAAQVYKMAAQMVRADTELSAILKPVDSTKTIGCRANGSLYQALSSESGAKHGYNPSLVIYDELAQSKSRELYDVLDTSMGARLEPLFAVISTQSNDPEHILSKLIDDGVSAKDPRIVCHLYEVPEDCKNIFDPKVWKKANPALGDFRSFADLKAIADKAERMPAEEPKFRNLYLNQRVALVASLISRAEWTACAGDVAQGRGLSRSRYVRGRRPNRAGGWRLLILTPDHSERVSRSDLHRHGVVCPPDSEGARMGGGGFSIYAIFLAAIVLAHPRVGRLGLLLIVGLVALASIELKPVFVEQLDCLGLEEWPNPPNCQLKSVMTKPADPWPPAPLVSELIEKRRLQ